VSCVQNVETDLSNFSWDERMDFKGLLELIGESAWSNPDRRAFTYLDYASRGGDSRVERNLSIGQLHERALALAARLQANSQRGEHVLLLFRPGLDFVVAFVACVYAGVVAIPVPAPRRGMVVKRLQTILGNSGANLALATSSTRDITQAHLEFPTGFEWLLVDGPDEDEACEALLLPTDPHAVAMLQYSSGSTSEPKGVMITHANLIHQAGLIFDQVGAAPGDCWGTWLPTYHDMGLISAIVTPLAKQLHSVIMAPEAFITRPARWLRALSDFRVSCSASPNFGYKLCARKVRDDELDGVDLSCVRFAVSGAEPIRSTTIEHFVNRFGPFGFGGNVIYPAYGLAEATLLVTGRSESIKVRHFSAASLSGAVVEPVGIQDAHSTCLVSSGRPCGGNRVVIADPETGAMLADGHIGEIRVAGESVAAGYLDRGGDTVLPFSGTIAGAEGEKYLYTGDLGFMFEGELFVCGRLKDLLVIHGKNHHASDIEQTVEAIDERFVTSGIAAFAISVDDEERLVVLQELERSKEGYDNVALADITERVRRTILERHQISPYDIVLISGGLARTTSGKVRRHECRELYLGRRLKQLFASRGGAPDGVGSASGPNREAKEQHGAVDLEARIARQIARHFKNGVAEPIAEAALLPLLQDTPRMTAILDDINRSFGLLVRYSVFFDYHTIGEVAAYLADAVTELESGRSGVRSIPAEQAAPSNQAFVPDDAVAIVGIACRFPSASGPRELWENLCKGVDSVTEVPPERWDADSLYDPNPLAMGKMNTKYGGFIKDIELFDARFFGIQNREAKRMDPAHRILMELSWELFEDAGVPPESVSGKQIGVFVGISGSDYAQLQFGGDAVADPYAGIGCALTNSASRISHFHNLRGPALAIDTACSSSLSAMHIGVTAVQSGECEMALVGGVNLILAPSVTMSLSKVGMMAPDGRCKAFDERANGYVRSEGAGLLLLKSLSKAKADGDVIYAVVRGSATNQDGHSSAIAAPNGEAQQRVVRSACEKAGISPGDLDYVEAHGTGTAVGDPIEVNALGELLKQGGTTRVHPIGSIKTNIGHCESAAGVAGLIKAAMVLHSGLVPPSLHFEKPNPLIRFDDYPLRVQRDLAALATADRPRLAGVNSFGIGGTNVHVVLEEYIDPVDTATRQAHRGQRLLTISGKSERAMNANAEILANYLRGEGVGVALADVCRTAAVHRTHFNHRLCVSGFDREGLASAIEGYLQTRNHQDVAVGHHNGALGAGAVPEVAFVFAGHGAQWPAMGRRLLATEEVFRLELERCDTELSKHTGWSVIDVLSVDDGDSRLADTVYLQPTLFALQYAITALLKSWGVIPSAVVGHSFGEITAACVAGSISFESACRLVAARARLMGELKGTGRMVSVEMPVDMLEPMVLHYGTELSIAGINSPGTTVVSGTESAIRAFIDELNEQDVTCVELELDYPFHSALVETVGAWLVAEMQGLEARVPTIPLMSTVRTEWVDENHLPTAEYWGLNAREPVRFKEAIERMAKRDTRIFLEIGAHPTLNGAISRTLTVSGARGVALPTLKRHTDDDVSMKRCIAALHARGVAVDWGVLCADGTLDREMPHYAWQRDRYWLDAAHHEARKRLCAHPLVSMRMPVAQPTWQSRLDINAQPSIRSTRVHGQGRLSNGLHVEVAMNATVSLSNPDGHRELVNLTFMDALGSVEDDALPMLQTRVVSMVGGCYDICVDAQSDDSQGRAECWSPVFSCSALVGDATTSGHMDALHIDALTARNTMKFSGAEVYRKLGEIGVEYVSMAHVASDIHLAEGSALLHLNLAERSGDAERFHLHPLMFEALEQACRLASGSDAAFTMLRSVRRLRVFGTLSNATYAYATLHDRPTLADEGSAIRADAWVLDAAGGVIALAEGMEFELPAGMTFAHTSGIPKEPAMWRCEVEWVHIPVADAPAPQEPAHWLILADAGGVADGVAQRLRDCGQVCLLVCPGDTYTRPSPWSCTVNRADSSDLERLVRELYVDGDLSCRAVLHFWNLDVPSVAEDVPADYVDGVTSLVDVVRALSMAELTRAPRLWLVTAGAQQVEMGLSGFSLLQSMAWGCAKTIVHEHAELRCARVDLSRGSTAAELDALCHEVLAERLDDQIAFRGERRYVAHLRFPGQADTASVAEPSGRGVRTWSVGRNDDGKPTLDSVVDRRHSPNANDVEIRVVDAAVRFVETAGTPMADTTVGTVLRIGAAVQGIVPGQRVVSIDGTPLASHQLVHAGATAVLDDAGSGIGMVAGLRNHLTALFGMRDVARIGRGERVLMRIEDAQRGLAAVRVALWLGATLFVTAPKHLQAQLSDLKIERVFDEGDPLDYALAAAVCGRVAAIIDATGEFDASFCPRFLSPFGRYIDLFPNIASQKRSISLVQRDLPGNCSYAAVDFDGFRKANPEGAHALLEEIVQLFAKGAFVLDHVDALDVEDMATAWSSGAGILTVTLEGSDTLPSNTYRDDATYLITGGLGGLGLAMAKRMVRDGARHLVLVGRRPPSLSALDIIEEINTGNAHCEAMSVDIADMNAVNGMFEAIQVRMPPLAGVIHAAGILDNGMLVQMGHDQVRSVMPAKVHGAWNLHRAVADKSLDFFVVFSSLASFIGSPGQANYAAANAFLEALVEYRRAQGLPALSIAWGPWSEVGMAADVHNLQRLAQHGMGMVPPDKGLDLLEDLILEHKTGAMGALPMNWDAWARTRGYAAQTPYFASLLSGLQAASGSGNGRITPATLTGKSSDEQMELLLAAIRRTVCNALMLDADQVELDAPLISIGLDSIVSLELKDRIESSIDVIVRTNALVSGKSIRDLAEQFRKELTDTSTDAASAAPQAVGTLEPDASGYEGVLERIDDLTNAEIEAILSGLNASPDDEAVAVE
jgi:acyl transferase domain-containing protein/acyl-CoA synthetase (AMP-forming)/AMP-acid ligase II/NADP-dependent 3-hydroxy acid dehydrogenase YdfG/NADPH:quinone reductase-like Zn-dependent oxidoreductase/acyl carrier protein